MFFKENTNFNAIKPRTKLNYCCKFQYTDYVPKRNMTLNLGRLKKSKVDSSLGQREH